MYIFFIVSLNLRWMYTTTKSYSCLSVLNAFCYCFTVGMSGWHYKDTSKPPCLLWGWLVYHTTPSTHNLIKCQIPYVWPPPHHYTKQHHYCATIDITDWLYHITTLLYQYYRCINIIIMATLLRFNLKSGVHSLIHNCLS